jgi:Ca2+-transporting ATPase
VRLGRRIYDNLRKAMGYILAIHVPIAGLALLPVLFGWPLMLTPMLIALLELIIDPACSVVLEAEPEEHDVMRRPPRHPRSHLLSKALVSWSLVQGAVALGAVALLLLLALRRGMAQDEIRALSFVLLVGLNLVLIFVNRTFSTSLATAFAKPNRALSIGLGVVVVVLALILGIPEAREFFDLGPLHADDLAVCAAGLVMALLVMQLLRLGWRRRLET